MPADSLQENGGRIRRVIARIPPRGAPRKINLMLARPNALRMLERFDDTSLAALREMIEASEFRTTIEHEAALLGPGVIRKLHGFGIKIRSVGAKDRITELSAVIKRFGIAPPPGCQGLYVPFDKALYIIVPMAGVTAHELGHALDHALCLVQIPDGFDPLTASLSECERVRPFRTQQDASFAKRVVGNRQAISAYAATNLQEAWAEQVRALTNCNDTGNLFDELSAAKYRAINRESYAFTLGIFLELNGRAFERWRHADVIAA